MRFAAILCVVLTAKLLVPFDQSSIRIAGVQEPPELTGEPKTFTPPSAGLRQFSAIMGKWQENDP